MPKLAVSNYPFFLINSDNDTVVGATQQLTPLSLLPFSELILITGPRRPMSDNGTIEVAMVANGYSYNQNGGAYRNGVARPLEDKARVAGVYLEMLPYDSVIVGIK
jgi:hypothetical protein